MTKKINTIAANKISPTFLVDESLLVQSRNLRRDKSPPKFSADCNCRFYRYTAQDNSKVTLLADYTGRICKDLLNEDFLNEADLANKVNSTLKCNSMN